MRSPEYVVHVKHDDYDEYVGRPSPLGNPYTHLPHVAVRPGMVAVESRDEAIQKYIEWARINPWVFYYCVDNLRDKTLGCHCYPQHCHADFLAYMANKEYKRILICGPRDWGAYLPVFCVVAGLKKRFGPDIVIVHGGAKGVDTLADKAAKALGLERDPYPADWRYGTISGNVRNREMLSKDIDLVVAIGYGKGTADCMSAARDMGILGIWRHFPGFWPTW